MEQKIEELSFGKRIIYDDIMSYAKQHKIFVNNKYFEKYKFLPNEIDWIQENKDEEIKMQNDKIQADLTNEKIVELQLKINELIKENKGLSSPNTSTIGWKGTNSLTLKKLSEKEWLVTEHRKQKKSGKDYHANFYIPVKNVETVWKIIQMLTDYDKPTTKYRDVVKALLLKYKLNIDIEAFNGGKNRGKYLFPLYYYPVKILESLNYIEYGGQGKITILKNKQVKI